MTERRVTSKQVDDILLWGKPDPTIEAICRDWLDMHERLAALERVVEAVRGLYPEGAWKLWGEVHGDGSSVGPLVMNDAMGPIIRAVLALDATRSEPEATDA